MNNTKLKLYFVLSLVLFFRISCSINKNIIKAFSEKSSHKELFKLYHYIFEKPYDLNSKYALEKYKIFKNNLLKYEIYTTKRI